jgi:hypothetical protein
MKFSTSIAFPEMFMPKLSKPRVLLPVLCLLAGLLTLAAAGGRGSQYLLGAQGRPDQALAG